MKSANQSAADCPIVSRDRVINTMRTLLRTKIVVERKVTAEQVALHSGVSLRAIRSYMANDAAEAREPSLSAVLSIIVVLGKPAVNGVLADIGYGNASPLDECAEHQPLASAVHAMQALGRFMECAVDNRIDHTEEPVATEAADTIIAEILPFSSAGHAA